jgi:hypothetical protein
MRLSASGVPRALKCAASVVLPHQDYVTDAALAGVDRHADLEAAADLGLTACIPTSWRCTRPTRR